MTQRLLPAVAAMLLVAGCSMFSPPAAPPPVVARRAPPPDWFQQQLAAAREARATHLPKSDTTGAQAAYDGVVRAACAQVALSGPAKYQPRCATVLRAAQPPPADPSRATIRRAIPPP